jgi:hypothetical protein
MTPTAENELIALIKQIQEPHRLQKALTAPIPLLVTDACSSATAAHWGAVLLTTGGKVHWAHGSFLDHQKYHINVLELLAAGFALEAFPFLNSTCVIWAVDNTAACNIYRRGRTSSYQLTVALRWVKRLAHLRNVTLIPLWVATDDNPADDPSRSRGLTEESMTKLQRLAQVCGMGGVGESLLAILPHSEASLSNLDKS